MHGYFVPLYKWMFEEPIFKNAEVFKTLCWFIYKSKFKDEVEIVNNSRVEVKRGEVLLKSRKETAEKLNITENSYRTILKLLVKLGEIEIKATNKYTIVKLIKWRPLENKSPTEHHQDTNKPPSGHHQSTGPYINKNNINIKNNKNIINNKNSTNELEEFVPTPKATKFSNFTPSKGFECDKAWMAEHIKKQIEKHGFGE